MKHNAVVLAARPALIPFSPRKSVIPRRVPVSLWEIHLWIKKTIRLRKRSDTRPKTQTRRWRVK